MRWNQKRDIYGALLKNSISLLHGYQAVASLMAVSRDPVVIYKKWEELGTVYQDFMQSASLAFIFCREEVNTVVNRYMGEHDPPEGNLTLEWLEAQSDKTSELLDILVHSAKQELLLNRT